MKEQLRNLTIKLLNLLFNLEEIDGVGRCPTYLYRWLLLKTRWFSVYIHRFVADDWSLDFHDHPKRFVSIGMLGRYVEETPIGKRVFKAPWFRTFPAEHIHRIALIARKPCWTLVIVFAAYRPWGFWNGGKWFPWKEYAFEKGGKADERKACQ